MTDNRSEPLNTEEKRELRWVEQTSTLLDSSIRIPGTGFRIGLDPIIGLIPVAGNLVTFGMSALLVWTMVKHGVSGKLVLRMMFNVLIDTIIGSIPLLGNLFDFGFKSNQRNVQLLREYHYEGKHRGNAWGLWISIVVLVLLWIAGTIWLLAKAFQWINTQWAGF